MSEFLHIPFPDFDLWMTTAYAEAHAERQRAHDKHDKPTSPSMERRPWDDPCWRDVLVEEVGEVAKCFNDYRHDEAPDDDVLRRELRKELVQVAAMTCAWIDALDERQATWLRAIVAER